MPQASDLVAYLSASHPEDDVSTSGGARSTTARPLDSQFAANAVAAVVSDNAADNMNVTVKGRLASGAIDTEVIALNGTTEAVGAKTWERILTVTIASPAAGTVLLRQGSGGTTRHTFAPGELKAAIFFIAAAADPSSGKTRYEKYFWENEHASEALLSAQLQLSSDPNSNYRVAVAGAVDDAESVADRETAPSGETFVDDGVDQAVPGTDLGATVAIGHWVEQTLAAAEAAAKETFTTQISGSSV